MARKFNEAHKGCPYYDKDANKCVNTGCLFINPCTLSEEYRRSQPYARRAKKPYRSRA